MRPELEALLEQLAEEHGLELAAIKPQAPAYNETAELRSLHWALRVTANACYPAVDRGAELADITELHTVWSEIYKLQAPPRGTP